LFSSAPVKRVRKKYLDDKTLTVPLRTLNRWKKTKENARKSLYSSPQSNESGETSEGTYTVLY